jgi:hypothetical protein
MFSDLWTKNVSKMIKQWSKVIKLSLQDHQKITFFILFQWNSIKKNPQLGGFFTILSKFFNYA